MTNNQSGTVTLSVKVLYKETKEQLPVIRPIYYISSVKNGNVKDYMEALDPIKQKTLIALLKLIATSVRIYNKEKYNNLGNGVFEIKSDIIRIYCFEDGKNIICTHGRNKPKKKVLRNDIKKVLYWRELYFKQ